MHALSSSDLLDLWEYGSGLHPLDRGLLALSAAFPEIPPASLADWTLGRRNKALIELHCSFFDPTLGGWTTCAGCEEKMEFEINGGALVNESVDALNLAQGFTFKDQCFRLPTSRDLAKAAQQKDAEAAAICLMERCRTNVEGPVQWTQEDVEQVGEKMAVADPLAEIRIALSCPSCGRESTETLEIISFIWSAIEARAKRLVWEVHAIASMYGWTEKEVLSLSPARRALYMEMVQA
jgi:hypothetical protein